MVRRENNFWLEAVKITDIEKAFVDVRKQAQRKQIPAAIKGQDWAKAAIDVLAIYIADAIEAGHPDLDRNAFLEACGNE